MTMFSGKSERKVQRNRVSTASSQNSIAVEDGIAVEKTLFSRDVYCLTGAEIINLLKEVSETGPLPLTSGQS